MENIIIIIVGLIIVIIAIIILAMSWGKNATLKEQAEDNEEIMEDYENVDAKPPVDNPFGRMRKKGKRVP
jgi:flagellar basal body-associated protein FliL